MASTNTQFAVAVHVLTYLAGAAPTRPVSSDELAGSTGTNPVYVRRVLGPLREAGIVRARPGSGGGWELARAADAVTLDELWRVIHEGDAVLGIHAVNPACPVGTGVQHALEHIDEQVVDAVRAALARRTVADVLVEAQAATAATAVT